jgi:DNA polymerase III delta prime subunit
MNTTPIAQFFASQKIRTQPILVLGSAETNWQMLVRQLQQMLDVGPADTVEVLTPPSIAELRATVQRIQLRPMHGLRTLVVFGQFESWSAELATTILKTIEEPPSFAIIVLCATKTIGILPTIRSRVVLLRLGDSIDAKRTAQRDTSDAAQLAGLSLKDQFAKIQKLADGDMTASAVLGDWLANSSDKQSVARQLLQLTTIIGETPVNRRLALESAALLVHAGDRA